MPAPFVSIEGSYDAWFAAKSKNFREQMRRRRKKFAAAGGTFRAATEATLDADFDAFVRLHHRRWEARGGSGVLTPGVEKAVYRVAKESLSSGRVRLWSMEVAGAVISSHFFAAAGGEVSYWLGGFDDSWGSHQPSLQVLLIALEQAFAMGDSRFDLGGGGQAYKYRLADSDEPVVWTHLVPHGPHRGLARLALGPRQLRRAVLARLPDGTKNRVKRLVGRQVFDGPPRAS